MSVTNGLRASVLCQGPAGLVVLAGDLDIATREIAASAVAEVVALGARVVEIDMSGVVFCDVVGLGTLINLKRAADVEGVDLFLINVKPGLAHLLTMAGVLETLSRLPAG